MTNLELQCLLLVAELEIFVARGGSLPTDIIICMNNFRAVELLEHGKNDYNIKKMVVQLKSEFGNINKN